MRVEWFSSARIIFVCAAEDDPSSVVQKKRAPMFMNAARRIAVILFSIAAWVGIVFTIHLINSKTEKRLLKPP